jgi:hypothetical protein
LTLLNFLVRTPAMKYKSPSSTLKLNFKARSVPFFKRCRQDIHIYTLMRRLNKNNGCSEYPSGSHQKSRVGGCNEKSRIDHRRSAFYDAVTSCTQDGWKLSSLNHNLAFSEIEQWNIVDTIDNNNEELSLERFKSFISLSIAM